LINDDSFLDVEMGSFAKNINKEVLLGHWFFPFLDKIWWEENSKHTKFDVKSRFKSLKSISSFISHEQKLTIVAEYDRSMFPMFSKFYPMLCGYIFFDIS
jgi:hypothetical protein